MPDIDHITRIDALTRNARNTWFALLGVLVFVGITLMGVEHIDFYGVGRATKLPLVDVEVPTRYFFVAAPILTAAIYGYFHLYLIRLWDALSAAPANDQATKQTLGDAISPWLVTDAALHLRARWRSDDCTTPRTLEGPAMLLNLGLAWGFGWVILGALWWMSMPARSWWLTGSAGLALMASLYAGAASFAMLFLRMKTQTDGKPPHLWSSVPAMASLLVIIPLMASVSWQLTSGATHRLTTLDLSNENIVEKPSGWLPHAIARKDFLAQWCKRESVSNCKELSKFEAEEFNDEWWIRRSTALAELRQPNWRKPNFRKASMQTVFLSGANLDGAYMERAEFSGSQLEGTTLKRTHLEDAEFFSAHLMGADFSGGHLTRTNLLRADLQRAIFFKAKLTDTIFTETRMKGVDFREAQMLRTTFISAHLPLADFINASLSEAIFIQSKIEGSNFSNATIFDANFYKSQMSNVNFTGATLKNVFLHSAIMKGAVFDYSFISGHRMGNSHMAQTNLSSSINNGGAIRYVDLTQVKIDQETDFRNAFLDGSVQYADEFSAQMGWPCQWAREVMSDVEFYGRWRWWVESKPDYQHDEEWSDIAPIQWRDVAINPHPDPNCKWKTGPMPTAD